MDGNHIFPWEPPFAKRILGVHKTKEMIGKLRQRSLFTFPVLLGFRAQVQAGPSYARAQAFNWKSRYSLFTDVCLLFAQLLLRRLLLLQENQRERKKGQSSSKRESIYRVSRNVSVFFATTTVKLFFSYRSDSNWFVVWAINSQRKPHCFASTDALSHSQ